LADLIENQVDRSESGLFDIGSILQSVRYGPRRSIESGMCNSIALTSISHLLFLVVVQNTFFDHEPSTVVALQVVALLVEIALRDLSWFGRHFRRCDGRRRISVGFTLTGRRCLGQ
jgi:hypothetical protein